MTNMEEDILGDTLGVGEANHTSRTNGRAQKKRGR